MSQDPGMVLCSSVYRPCPRLSHTKILISASLRTAIEILHNHRLAISARYGVAHLLAGTLL